MLLKNNEAVNLKLIYICINMYKYAIIITPVFVVYGI